MQATSETNPPSNRRSPARVASRWALVVLIGLGSALIIDLGRQALISEKVQWATLTPAETPSRHIDPVSSAYASAAREFPDNRPRLIRFTADWCPPCNSMSKRVFSKDDVADAIHDRFDAYSVDLTSPGVDENVIADRYRIAYLPTLLITDANGQELARLDRDVDAQDFLEWLDRGWDQWEQIESGAQPADDTSGGLPISHMESIN
ncbi:thioredoxin family protein [Algisphaera agarilytica]|uniref:Thiol:disulfide interchange protein n=1 Tax=Algisphaera agarilytica TaxID=1385975 RepID=A0A7X0HAW0_9BACT|nr:thioredoxin family protein [Algisphaera agarilytica]MBB6431019.1 thiol:disulfide interchange protein [Algisphaera agarilytica]